MFGVRSDLLFTPNNTDNINTLKSFAETLAQQFQQDQGLKTTEVGVSLSPDLTSRGFSLFLSLSLAVCPIHRIQSR